MGNIDYYNRNAEKFYSSTVDLDMGEFYTRFTAALPRTPAKILDAGCGSGRDSKYFKSLGHTVTPFDASEEMAQRASDLLNMKVETLTFQEMSYEDEFDGIWACASLLHVPRTDMPSVVAKCHRALRAEGIIYASFKYGTDEATVEERTFNNYTEDSVVSDCFPTSSRFTADHVWTTNDIRPGRENERWVNIIASKV